MENDRIVAKQKVVGRVSYGVGICCLAILRLIEVDLDLFSTVHHGSSIGQIWTHRHTALAFMDHIFSLILNLNLNIVHTNLTTLRCAIFLPPWPVTKHGAESIILLLFLLITLVSWIKGRNLYLHSLSDTNCFILNLRLCRSRCLYEFCGQRRRLLIFVTLLTWTGRDLLSAVLTVESTEFTLVTFFDLAKHFFLFHEAFKRFVTLDQSFLFRVELEGIAVKFDDIGLRTTNWAFWFRHRLVWVHHLFDIL